MSESTTSGGVCDLKVSDELFKDVKYYIIGNTGDQVGILARTLSFTLIEATTVQSHNSGEVASRLLPMTMLPVSVCLIY